MNVILGKFQIMVIKQSIRGGWSGVATNVRRSRVPLVIVEYKKTIVIGDTLLTLKLKCFKIRHLFFKELNAFFMTTFF
jgi:hypothetical protein